MKTLYITDLDDTLLRSDKRISAYTAAAINRFIDGGGYFTYATARSISSALEVAGGVDWRLPVVCSDGVYIIDPANNETCIANNFTAEETAHIRLYLEERGTSPIVFARVDGRVRFSFIGGLTNPAVRYFLDARLGDSRWREVDCAEELYRGEIYRILWTPESVDSIDGEESRFAGFSRRDYEAQADLCDVLPLTATKANAALQLKAILGCDRLVVFGDGHNDLSMFAVADECYAVRNAIAELADIATAVIGANEEDGVARWIEMNAGDAKIDIENSPHI